ncbi:MAG: redox-regulated ATPase YchF [Deltaproteobacteria bacterium]|nr:redox-regulated ATPase YchF [Deltaproteobacteria bacterium]
MKIGLVGFPGSGKTTVFNALTGLAAETGYGAARGKTNLGVVKVPDVRVDALAKIFKPKKNVYAEITFCDVALATTPGQSRGLDDQILRAMREVDALCHVVRGFASSAGETARPLREAHDFEAEMNLSDLILVENRLERLKKEKAKPAEKELLGKLKAHLDAGQPLRSLDLGATDLVAIAGYRFLTLKPLMLILDVAEADAAAPPPADLAEHARTNGLGLVVLAGAVEMDIAQMAPEDQKEFVASLGLDEPAAGRFIRAAYALCDLISFLTVGEDECRAWPLRKGSSAHKAAGKIHSDIERGFIRAEVMRWEDLVRLGSEAKCREAGRLRLEGKDYVVADGDVINFRFNV